MTAVEFYWDEADKTWDLARLYQDLGIAKGRKLTELQKAKLRGALCSVGLKDVAKRLHRELKGLRTDLSKGLYRFIQEVLWKHGIECDGKVYWQQIPRLLSQAGYSRQSTVPTQEMLDAISVKPTSETSIRASAIIEAIEIQQVRNKLDRTNHEFPVTVANKLKEDGDQAAKKKDFETAIHCYRIPVEQDLSYAPFLIKIAMCFDKLHWYSDSVEIALKALPLFTERDQISQLNGVLGSAFHDLAIYTQDVLILWQALSYYKKALDRTEGPNVLGLWNSFDLLGEFSLLKASESEKYLRKAKLAFCDFKDIAHDQNSNFGQYRQNILADAQRICLRIDDVWIKNELLNLRNLEHTSIY